MGIQSVCCRDRNKPGPMFRATNYVSDTVDRNTVRSDLEREMHVVGLEPLDGISVRLDPLEDQLVDISDIHRGWKHHQSCLYRKRKEQERQQRRRQQAEQYWIDPTLTAELEEGHQRTPEKDQHPLQALAGDTFGNNLYYEV